MALLERLSVDTSQTLLKISRIMQALPAFRSLLLARSPVALSVSDCSEVPAILKAAKVRVRNRFLTLVPFSAPAAHYVLTHP